MSSSGKFSVVYTIPGLNLHNSMPMTEYSRSESVGPLSLEEAQVIRDRLKKFYVNVKIIMTITKEVE